MKCASDQRSIDSSLVCFFSRKRKKKHLFKRRIKPNNSDFGEFSFSDVMSWCRNFAFFIFHNQFSTTFDFVWTPRVFQYFINAFRLSVRLSKMGLKWNPIIILDIGAKRNSYHRLVLLSVSLCVCLLHTCDGCLRRSWYKLADRVFGV